MDWISRLWISRLLNLQGGIQWLIFTLPLVLCSCTGMQTQAVPTATPAPPKVQYRTWQTDRALIHVLKIPTQANYQVVPAVRPELTVLGDWVNPVSPTQSGNRVLAAVNAGFFDPSNQQASAYVILNGKTVADPHENPNLMQNPNLKPYLSQILNRSEFRRYTCAGQDRYDIALHQEPTPVGCQLQDALGAGPRLLPDFTPEDEAFVDEQKGVRVRDPLGIDRPNARTAIALTAHEILWVMVAQLPNAEGASGLTLPELRDLLKQQGAIAALNLDGGSSSSFYYNGKTWYGKRHENNRTVQRPIKSALFLYERNEYAPTAKP